MRMAVTPSEGANVTQWFARLLNILTGRMNRKGGPWFHPASSPSLTASSCRPWTVPYAGRADDAARPTA
jgi:hypothetical protein